MRTLRTPLRRATVQSRCRAPPLRRRSWPCRRCRRGRMAPRTRQPSHSPAELMATQAEQPSRRSLGMARRGSESWAALPAPCRVATGPRGSASPYRRRPPHRCSTAPVRSALAQVLLLPPSEAQQPRTLELLCRALRQVRMHACMPRALWQVRRRASYRTCGRVRQGASYVAGPMAAASPRAVVCPMWTWRTWRTRRSEASPGGAARRGGAPPWAAAAWAAASTASTAAASGL
jgi:hypothetical protein